eukprot:gene1639-4773_t
MARLESCRRDLVELVSVITELQRETGEEAVQVPSFSKFARAWRKLSFSAVHLAANDRIERQLVLEDMCHAATDMLESSSMKVPMSPNSWHHIIRLYNTWTKHGRIEPLFALRRLLQEDVIVWVAVHPSKLRLPRLEQGRLWTYAVEKACALDQGSNPTHILSDSAIELIQAIETKYTMSKAAITSHERSSLTRTRRDFAASLLNVKHAFLKYRDQRLEKVLSRMLRRPSRVERSMVFP